MNPKQHRFVSEYLTTGNALQAAIAAGYSEHTAQAQGSRLLRHPEVMESLQREQQEAMQSAGVTLISLLTELENARKQALANGQASAAVSATMSKARLLGLDKPQPAVTVEAAHTIRVILED